MFIINSRADHSIRMKSLLQSLVNKVPLYQETDQEPVWDTLKGQKDDVFIYDRCGRLTYYIPLPLSFLNKPLVRIAIFNTYFAEPCGQCNDTLSSEINATLTTESWMQMTTKAGSHVLVDNRDNGTQTKEHKHRNHSQHHHERPKIKDENPHHQSNHTHPGHSSTHHGHNHHFQHEHTHHHRRRNEDVANNNDSLTHLHHGSHHIHVKSNRTNHQPDFNNRFYNHTRRRIFRHHHYRNNSLHWHHRRFPYNNASFYNSTYRHDFRQRHGINGSLNWQHRRFPNVNRTTFTLQTNHRPYYNDSFHNFTLRRNFRHRHGLNTSLDWQQRQIPHANRTTFFLRRLTHEHDGNKTNNASITKEMEKNRHIHYSDRSKNPQLYAENSLHTLVVTSSSIEDERVHQISMPKWRPLQRNFIIPETTNLESRQKRYFNLDSCDLIEDDQCRQDQNKFHFISECCQHVPQNRISSIPSENCHFMNDINCAKLYHLRECCHRKHHKIIKHSPLVIPSPVACDGFTPSTCLMSRRLGFVRNDCCPHYETSNNESVIQYPGMCRQFHMNFCFELSRNGLEHQCCISSADKEKSME